ncbi:MAG: hypothetical protein D6712_01020 [Chloroflexi bacterium]|nr:MAG: hypothetical protein D6712_01020 [Chloroflexota bacterium]
MSVGLIFRDTLRQNWRQILYWGGGLGLLAVYIFIAIPDMNALQQYANLVNALPPAILDAFGMSDAEMLATPDGFIIFGVFGYGILIMAVFAVMAGMGVTANEEDDGILDMVLSLPLPRWRLIVEKTLAYLVIAAGIVTVMFLALAIGTNFSGPEIREQVHLDIMAKSAINLLPSVTLMITATVFAGAFFRRKATAMGVVAAFIIVSYFMDFLAEVASGALSEFMKAASFFTYFNSEGVMREGLNFSNIALLLGVSIVLFAASIWAFQRRDIGA